MIFKDAFVEQKLIIDQLQTLTSDSFLLAKDKANREEASTPAAIIIQNEIAMEMKVRTGLQIQSCKG